MSQSFTYVAEVYAAGMLPTPHLKPLPLNREVFGHHTMGYTIQAEYRFGTVSTELLLLVNKEITQRWGLCGLQVVFDDLRFADIYVQMVGLAGQQCMRNQFSLSAAKYCAKRWPHAPLCDLGYPAPKMNFLEHPSGASALVDVYFPHIDKKLLLGTQEISPREEDAGGDDEEELDEDDMVDLISEMELRRFKAPQELTGNMPGSTDPGVQRVISRWLKRQLLSMDHMSEGERGSLSWDLCRLPDEHEMAMYGGTAHRVLEWQRSWYLTKDRGPIIYGHFTWPWLSSRCHHVELLHGDL